MLVTIDPRDGRHQNRPVLTGIKVPPPPLCGVVSRASLPAFGALFDRRRPSHANLDLALVEA
jgi:hypothetical protein